MRSLREVMRGNLLVFTLGDVMRMLSMFVTFPFFSLYIQALGGSTVDIGIVNSLRPLSSIFIYPIAGYLSEHYSRVKIIAVTVYLSASLWLFFMLANDWRILALGNMFQGVWAFYFPAANSLMADSLPPGKRGVGYSLWIAIPSAVGIISPYIGGFLITMFGVVLAMKLLYGLTMVTALVIATMNFKFLKEPRTHKSTTWKPFSVLTNSYRGMFNVLKRLSRSLKAYAVMLVISFFFNNLTTAYWVIHGVNEVGLNELQWSLVLLIAAAVNVMLLLPAGMVVDRFGVKKVLTLALALVAIPILIFPSVRGFTDIVLIFIVMTFANSFLISAAPALMAQYVPDQGKGSVMAALGQGMLYINTSGAAGGGPGMGAILTIPSIIGSLLGGFIYGYNPALPWILLGSSALINAAICTFLISPPKR